MELVDGKDQPRPRTPFPSQPRTKMLQALLVLLLVIRASVY
jgi:hypothetical protein